MSKSHGPVRCFTVYEIPMGELDQAARLSWRELDSMLEFIHDGIWVIDADGVTRRVNRAMERIAGIKAEEVVGRHVTKPLQEGRFKTCVTLRALKARHTVTLFDDYANGKRCLNTSTPVFDENGKVYSIVSPMVIKNSSPLAGVDGVFNAIMVTGDCVGDVMFYGKGAGKLPTASAVVADVVDAVKHSDRSKKIFWEKPAENIMADIDSKKFEYFVRTTDSAENVQKIFGKCEFVDNIIDNESAFVTSPLTKSEVEEKLAKLSDVVANIRVMD